MEKSQLPYLNYWRRKELANQPLQSQVINYYIDCPTSPLLEHIDSFILRSNAILDYGAGDLKLKKRLEKNGYSGKYYSLDISDEFDYSFSNVNEVNIKLDTILFLDVIEHLHLEDGLDLSLKLLNLLERGGHLIIQTPNGKCVRNHLGSDMTHKQLYNLSDLASYFMALGHQVTPFRVLFRKKKMNVFDYIKEFLLKILTAKILGVDYTDNILLIIKKN